MDLYRFARIQSRQDGKTRRGTGYFISNDVVLTARHVVEGAEEIRVEYQDFSGKRFKISARLSEWTSPLDVALLRVETELRIGRQVFFKGRLPADKAYRSRGWARASQDEEGSQDAEKNPVPKNLLDFLTGIEGTAYEFAAGAESFQISVKEAPDDTEAWKGVSGAPVLCGWHLVGIITEGNKFFGGKRLHAVPVAKLWEDEDFRREVGEYEEQERRLQKIIEDIAAILQKHPKTKLFLAREQTEWDEELPPRDFARRICEHPSWMQVLKACDLAHRKLRAGGQEPQAREVMKILCRVLPEIYRSTEFHVLPDGDGGQWMTLPYETKTLAELAIAGFEGRSLIYSPLESAGEVPFGAGLAEPSAVDALEESEEHGFDFTGEDMFQNWILIFAKSKSLKLAKSDLAMLAQPHRFKEHLPLVDRAIQRDVEAGMPRRYFCFPAGFRESHQEFLDLLREHLKSLHLIEMSGEMTRVQERLDTEPLAEILFRSQEDHL